MLTTNYHTHSTYCDGNNSLQEMAQSAYNKGFSVLGFSSHCILPFASNWHMDTRNFENYFYDIEQLKKEYSGKMEILAGIEADYFPPISFCDKKFYSEYKPDYILGSVHYLINHDLKNGGCFTVDGPAEEFSNGVEKYFNGDSKTAIQNYYSTQREMISNCDFDIIGHIDLVRKRNSELNYFSENDSWYRNELKETAKIVGKSGKVVEINTGGMTRAKLAEPYPSLDFLKILNAENVPVTICSDSHSIDSIDDHFDIAIETAKKAGYKELHYLSKGKWCSQIISN